jgi:anthraniloyl-CoA monooxygenase
MEDAAALAEALLLYPGQLETALAAFETERRPPVERFQEAALASADYFERVENLVDLPHATFAFNLLTRSGRVSHLDLQRQAPALAPGTSAPALAPLELRGVTLPHRLVGGSLGLRLSPLLAVRADGVRSLGDPLAGEFDEPTDVVVLGHTGPRAGSRPATEGLDRPPLETSAHPLAASPMSYTSRQPVARAATAEDLAEIVESFGDAAQRWRGRARLLLLDGAGGGLLASFLSSRTNRRNDAYGGDFENRLRFPREVVEHTRGAWPGPLGFRFAPLEWHPSGTDDEESVKIAQALVEAGADFVEISGGGAVAEDGRPFRPGYLVAEAARIRNAAKVPVMVGGGIFSLDQANTIIAAGRADLIRMSN